MKHSKILPACVVMLTLTLLQCNPSDNYPKKLDNLVPGASLIFKAKVVLLHTTTTDEDDVSNAGVLVVTEVIEAPEFLKNISGEQITIRFSNIDSEKVGDERMFFTEPYWIGENLGVQEKGSITKGDELYEHKELSKYIMLARNNQNDEDLKKLINDSKLVISGKVLKVKEVSEKKALLTEHDPEWKEAEIEIDNTLKGKIESKTIKILFASSKDVMFYRSPKFNAGDEGVFMIQQSDAQTASLLQNDNVILEPSAYIKGKENAKRIKSLIQ